MIETLIQPPNPFKRAHSKENTGYGMTANKDFMQWIKPVFVPPNPLGRHPFNILTEEIYGD